MTNDPPSIVIRCHSTLDTEKSFDWVNWQIKKKKEEAFGLGSTFQSWVSSLYFQPYAAVRVNEHLWEKFPFLRDAHQGCLLSLLLLAMVLEPFVTSVQNNLNVGGINIGQEEYKLALYEDNTMFNFKTKWHLVWIMAEFQDLKLSMESQNSYTLVWDQRGKKR